MFYHCCQACNLQLIRWLVFRLRKPLQALAHTENVGLSHLIATCSGAMAGLMRLVLGYGSMNKLLQAEAVQQDRE